MNLKNTLKESLLGQNRAEALNMTEADIQNRIETIISKTYLWVGIVLLIVFGLGYYVSTLFASGVIDGDKFGIFTLGGMIGGFLLVVLMSYKWQSFSYNTLATLLLVFAALEGLGISYIFMAYSMGSIINVFMITAVMFLLLAVAGNVLHVDVTKIGTILLVALIALIVGFVINMFWQNEQFNVLWSIFGLVIFAGFMIYDMNVLKQMAITGDDRVELIMALSLFLNFINIFFLLLRLYGSSD